MSAPNDPTQTNAPNGVADPYATLSRDSAGDGKFSTVPGPALSVEAVPLAVGRYEIVGEIARGGMGVVYRATDRGLNREVAVKVVRAAFHNSAAAVRRFTDEASITGQLQHPGIPPVHEVGTLPDGSPFLAMKLVKGRTLDDWLKARPDPAADRGRFVAVFEQVCQAVGYAHAHKVIHRDLKPANVMVGAFGEVQVMDWGLAKVLSGAAPTRGGGEDPDATLGTVIASARGDSEGTQAGSLLGTPAFMAPEQAMGAIDEVDARSDVFGLGAILCVILTGKPPYVGTDAEDTRKLAVRVKLDDASRRLDSCGAEPELVALCKRCLSAEKVDRPADAGELADAVAALRAAAEERARRAELTRVRRRLVIGAAAVLVVAAVGGLLAVLAVQRKANADLAAKNTALADEQAKVQARFDLAVKAIETFHTGVSEDMLLKNAEFKELRTKLLKEAAGFYADLEKLLEGQTDAKSRKSLAAAYFQLGELTDKIGTKPEALAVLRKALALRRDLAAAEGADVETRLDLARTLEAEAFPLYLTGEPTEALLAFEEARDIATALEAESATEAVRAVLAQSYFGIGFLLFKMGRPAEALEAYQKALAIRQKLADANPAVVRYQSDLATSHNEIGLVLMHTGKPEQALTACRSALAIQQKLAAANPAVIRYQFGLAKCHDYICWCLLNLGKPVEAAEADREALHIIQKLVDDHPADTLFQDKLANFQINLGRALDRQKRFPEAFAALENGLVTLQKLAKADPGFNREFGESHAFRGGARARAGQPAAAAADLRRSLELWSKLPSQDIEIQVERSRAMALLAGLGAEAKSGVTKDEARTFADQSVAALDDAVKTGWAFPSELREPDFDALRGRADFEKLVAEVGAKTEKATETAPPPHEKK